MKHVRVALITGVAAALCLGGGRASGAPRDAALSLVSVLDVRDEVLADAASGAGGSAGEHDPSRMFLLSLTIPGTGQIVQGEKRGYVYMLAEIAFWATYAALNDKGLDERSAYEAYAREHWDREAYLAFYDQECADNPDVDYDDGCRPLAEFGTQEYYEDIGKYDVYWPWWSDGGAPNDVTDDDLAVRNEYWGMRGDSNTHLRQARYYMMAAFLNHLVSAVDSFLSARRGGDPAEASAGLGLEFGVPDDAAGFTCALVVRQ
jgi:hypothetical protein